MDKSYYHSYEDRYQRVFKAGVKLWGNSRNDEKLVSVLTKWVENNDLVGKKIVEFACGEGEIGVILSELDCHYQGFDIAPSAVTNAKKRLQKYPHSSVLLKDLVTESINETYDALLDVMGFHMIVTDSDRINYLSAGYNCLKSGSPILFYRENYNEDAYEGVVENIEQYLEISTIDYKTPGKREVRQDGKTIEVYTPLIPARARSIDGYYKEFSALGFKVDDIIDLNTDSSIYKSVAIYGYKK